MPKISRAKTPGMSAQEAGRIIQHFADLGLPLNEVARRLSVTPLYANRLQKPAYWKGGIIPKKTSEALKRLLDEFSPDAQQARIVELANSLGKDDLYYIHTVRPIVEFHDKEVRLAIMRGAAKGVQTHYVFPNVKKIFEEHSGNLLDLADLIPSDLKDRYLYLMKTLRDEARESGVCSYSKLKDNILVEEQENGFLFSPWNKIIYMHRRRGTEVEDVIIQEHHSAENSPQLFGSCLNWECRGAQAERIGRILITARSRRIEWPT